MDHSAHAVHRMDFGDLLKRSSPVWLSSGERKYLGSDVASIIISQFRLSTTASPYLKSEANLGKMNIDHNVVKVLMAEVQWFFWLLLDTWVIYDQMVSVPRCVFFFQTIKLQSYKGHCIFTLYTR